MAGRQRRRLDRGRALLWTAGTSRRLAPGPQWERTGLRSPGVGHVSTPRHPRRPRPAAAGPVSDLDALPAESPLRAALRTEWEQLSLNGDEAPPAASGPATPPTPKVPFLGLRREGAGVDTLPGAPCPCGGPGVPAPAPRRPCSSQATPVAPVPSRGHPHGLQAAGMLDHRLAGLADFKQYPPPPLHRRALGPEGAQGCWASSAILQQSQASHTTPLQAPPSGEGSELFPWA